MTTSNQTRPASDGGWTKGPWEVVEMRKMRMSGEVHPVGRRTEDDCITPVAWVPSLLLAEPHDVERAKADARLISLAPEMAELLGIIAANNYPSAQTMSDLARTLLAKLSGPSL